MINSKNIAVNAAELKVLSEVRAKVAELMPESEAKSTVAEFSVLSATTIMAEFRVTRKCKRKGLLYHQKCISSVYSAWSTESG